MQHQRVPLAVLWRWRGARSKPLAMRRRVPCLLVVHQHGEAHARIGTAQASEGLFVAHCLGVLLALVIHAAKYLTVGLATKGGGFVLNLLDEPQVGREGCRYRRVLWNGQLLRFALRGDSLEAALLGRTEHIEHEFSRPPPRHRSPTRSPVAQDILVVVLLLLALAFALAAIFSAAMALFGVLSSLYYLVCAP